MAHFHIHTLPDGTETSAPIVDPDNEELHWHTVAGARTSSNGPLGGDHTHTIDGQTTSPPIDRDSNKGKNMTIETKLIGGNVVQVNQVERNGIPVGIIKGHIATFDIDRGLDRFEPGAFKESLERHLRDDRQIRLKDQHGRVIGGFPINLVVEDEEGLFGVGEINLEVQKGREAFALAKQGVLTDLSIGFTSIEDSISNGIRVISKAEIWEGSIVDEPMNPAARITEVKAVVPFDSVKEWTERDIEKFFKDTGLLSRNAAKFLTSRFDIKEDPLDVKKKEADNDEELGELLKELKNFKSKLASE